MLKIFDYEFGAEKEVGKPSDELIKLSKESDTGAVRARMGADLIWRPHPEGRLVYVEEWVTKDYPNS